MVAVAGVYGEEPEARLLWGSPWFPVGLSGKGLSWELDVGTGEVRHRLERSRGPVTTVRAAAAGHPGVQYWWGPSDGRVQSDRPEAALAILSGDGRHGVIVVAEQVDGDEKTVVMAGAAGSDFRAARRAADARLAGLRSRSATDLGGSQRRRWSDRWSRRPVEISGDRRAEARVRFALFRLLCLLDHDDELALGARGLTGPGYRGHVFWDTDVFVLPAVASVAPTAARAMVEYRLRRLDTARHNAEASGFAGARFPWESAASGSEVTPTEGRRPDGETVPIRTGELELHIGADICWAIEQYRRWTRSDEVLTAGGAELTAEVARFWASRATRDPDGSVHLRGVIGPDEYHEDVDDNAFTNAMAAWTLRRAAEIVTRGWRVGTDREAVAWREVAERLATGYDPTTRRHEQFAGYDQLQPVLAESVAPPPYPADLLLGRTQVAGSQLIKQADVLMLHAMIPADLPAGSLSADLDHYLPRTTHGSSLSPASHAELLARAGRPDAARHWFDLALAMDLDDLTGTGAGGLHYATIGGAWQAFLHGFVGVRLTSDGLGLCPSIPAGWGRVVAGFVYAGVDVQVEVDGDRAWLHASEPIAVVGGDPPTVLTPTARFDWNGREWRRR